MQIPFPEHLKPTASSHLKIDGSLIGSMGLVYFSYIYHTNYLNVGEYTSPMDPMGLEYNRVFRCELAVSFRKATLQRKRRLPYSHQTWKILENPPILGALISMGCVKFLGGYLKQKLRPPIGSMGRTVYSPTFTIKNSTNVGEYTIVPWILWESQPTFFLPFQNNKPSVRIFSWKNQTSATSNKN